MWPKILCKSTHFLENKTDFVIISILSLSIQDFHNNNYLIKDKYEDG